MKITLESRVGEIASHYPLSTRVFSRNKIDFCCGGGKTISAVCASKGLDTAGLISEIESEIQATTDPAENQSWEDRPLEDLIEHILKTYHRALDEELPRLEGMAEKVHKVHGDKDPNLEAIHSVFTDLKAELEQHMEKEEKILFPLIRAGRGRDAGSPVECMEHEHENAGTALAELRRLTGDFQVPDGACNTWRALWHGLEAFEGDMHQHIHLENNILFPRALAE